MTSSDFRQRLRARAASARLRISSAVEDKLEQYFRVLERWNARMNLTSLPLTEPTDETFDRLFIEPLAAARRVRGAVPKAWLDLGSGGGSPAIPLKIAVPNARLTMVESKSRKAAFLREAVRLLGLSETMVEVARFEELLTVRSADLITVRAVKADDVLFGALQRLLHPEGRVFVFHAAAFPAPPEYTVEVVSLNTGSGALLTILKPMFHVEHKR